MSSTIHQAREALGHRLRDLRKDAELTGKQLAELAGWHSSKVSRIEYGKQAPSETDIQHWCQLCSALDQVPDLIATVRNIETMYIEWRRNLQTGTRKRQEASIRLEAETKLFRWYEPVLIPGILHTAEYASAVMSKVIGFYDIPDDLDAGVSARMERQQILYKGDHRFHIIMAEQALRTMVGGPEVMIGQLDRLLAVSSLARVRLGIIPSDAPYEVPSNQFIMFDERMIHVEAISAELAITQPREVALYAKAFHGLSGLAVYGAQARSLIGHALERVRGD
ncbi:helix-turn-helix domain-containing protein [Nonomuraea typhae]|uniref:helix-turn-helix domain-containing protein n=1 Tax=Nonomuraea typhae TaxID=2603600 RepID=UPI0012FAFCF9|nr:helix-turn-helix transcriptional regulator [Nonomuraea typhae]